MKYSVPVDRDVNRAAFGGEFPCTVKRTITFAGATTNAWGNDEGGLDPGYLYTVTGLVMARLMAICTASLTGAGATINVSDSDGIADFMPATTATTIGSDEIWLGDTTPAKVFIVGEEQAAADNLPTYLINGNDIYLAIDTADVTGGTLEFYCQYRPISTGSSIVATTT